MAVVMTFFPGKNSYIILHLLRKMKKIICTLNSEDMISHCTIQLRLGNIKQAETRLRGRDNNGHTGGWNIMAAFIFLLWEGLVRDTLSAVEALLFFLFFSSNIHFPGGKAVILLRGKFCHGG